jgi:hypothetical protein
MNPAPRNHSQTSLQEVTKEAEKMNGREADRRQVIDVGACLQATLPSAIANKLAPATA